MPGVVILDPVDSTTYVTDRRLSALRSTYPRWEIFHIVGGPKVHEWTARLRSELTREMRAAGVVQHLERPDAFSLASALSDQVARLRSARASTWPYQDGPAAGA